MARIPSRRVRLNVHPLDARDLPAPLAASAGLDIDPAEYMADRVIVQTKSGLPPQSALAAKARALGGGLFSVILKPGVGVERALKHFHARAGIALAEPDYIVRAAVAPNDPRFTDGSLWGLNNVGQDGGTPDADIDASEAWDLTPGTGSTLVAVIDSGIDYTHPDLAANVWTNAREVPGDGLDNDGNGYKDDVRGYDFINNDADPFDDNGHGTHVAGTIAGTGNNGAGVTGVNWHTKVMALKFLDAEGYGTTSAAISALNYAVANGAKVSNNSWGGGGYSSALDTAISNARAKGHLFVAAAGNGGSDGYGDNNDQYPNYPANYPQDNVLAVAATDWKDSLASFSNYGATTVDLAAPGADILSTLPGNQYGWFSGTSMATPHVAGAAALVWDAHPDWTYQQVVQALKGTVDAKAGLTGKVATGGRLNLNGAVRFDPTPPAPPADTAGPRVTGVEFSGVNDAISRARVTFGEPIAAATFTAADVRLTGPTGTAISVSGVAAVSGSTTQFDVTFPSQTAVGTYTLTVGPAVADTAGNLMDQDADGVAGEATEDRYVGTTTLYAAKTYSSTDVNKAIVDYGRTVSTLTITDDVSIKDLNVTLSLTHTYVSDLRVTLVAPDGTSVVLFNRRGGSADNLTGTTFNDEASRAVSQGAAPFSGAFRPEQALSAFDGKSAKGTWKLVIDDYYWADAGKLSSWSLSVR